MSFDLFLFEPVFYINLYINDYTHVGGVYKNLNPSRLVTY